MPKETRFLTFYPHEIHKTLCILHSNEKRLPPPNGKIVKSQTSKDQQSLLFEIQKNTGDLETFTFPLTTFLTALITFCRECNIPVPRKGTKLLAVKDNNVTMKIEI